MHFFLIAFPSLFYFWFSLSVFSPDHLSNKTQGLRPPEAHWENHKTRAGGGGLVIESYLILLWCYGLYPTRLLCPWDFLGKNTGLVAISFSRGSSRPRDRTWISCVSYLAGGFFATKPHEKPKRKATSLSITSKYLRIMKQLDSIESLDTRASEDLGN